MRSVQLLAELCISCTPFAGFLGFSIAESTDTGVTLAIVGICSVLLTGLMIPWVRWMQRKLDGHDRQSAALAARREAREDARQEAFAAQVAALGAIVQLLETANKDHGDGLAKILKRLEELPAAIVNKCNGK